MKRRTMTDEEAPRTRGGRVKHTPASPLPHRLNGDAKHGYIVDKNGGYVDEIPFEAWGDEARALRKTWRYYIHAGNKYPLLVETLRSELLALKGWSEFQKLPDDVEVGITISIDKIERLLRALGEEAACTSA